jgi:hypothetical protein
MPSSYLPVGIISARLGTGELLEDVHADDADDDAREEMPAHS